MKKLPWTVWEAEKNGVQMIVITKGHAEEKGVSNPSIGFRHMHDRKKTVEHKDWGSYQFKYSIPFSSNSKAIQTMLKMDYGARFRPRKSPGGDDCWYCDEWIEELRECAEAITDGVVPVFNSEES